MDALIIRFVMGVGIPDAVYRGVVIREVVGMCVFVRFILRWLWLLYDPEMVVTLRQLRRLGLPLTADGFRKFELAGNPPRAMTWRMVAEVVGSAEGAYVIWLGAAHPVARAVYQAVIVRPFVFRLIYRDVIRSSVTKEPEGPDACDRKGWRDVGWGGRKQ